MKNPDPPEGWPCEHPPSKPGAYLAVCDILAASRGCPVDDLVPPDVGEWLKVCQPGYHRHIALKDDALISTINRLAAPPWKIWLEQNPVGGAVVCDLVLQLKGRLQMDEPTADKVSASLVARRLIQFVVAGVTDVSVSGVAALGSVRPMLPPPWCVPSAAVSFEQSCVGAFRHVRLSAWQDFLRDLERFWSADSWRSENRAVSHIDKLEEAELRKERNQPFFLVEESDGRSRVRGQVPETVVIETDNGNLRVTVPPSRRNCFAGVACLQSQLAPSFREMPAAIRALRALCSVKNQDLGNEHARDAALAASVILAGVPPMDVLNFGLNQNVTAAGALTSEGIFVHAGSGYYHSMAGRIPKQLILLRLPPSYELLIANFIHSYPAATCVADCFENHPLDVFLNFLANIGRLPATQAKFLHRAFLYAARRMVQMPAGILALLVGRPIGPYRSASNYQVSAETLVWLHKTQSCLLEQANLPAESCPWAVPGKDFGANARSLSEAVAIARETLASVSDKNQALASLELALAFHGRRP